MGVIDETTFKIVMYKFDYEINESQINKNCLTAVNLQIAAKQSLCSVAATPSMTLIDIVRDKMDLKQ